MLVDICEVHAHCSYLLVPRYFNAWVENGHLHIQTEFCEGGSLEAKAGIFLILATFFPTKILIQNYSREHFHRPMFL